MTNQQPARSAHTSPSQPPPARPGQPSTYPTQGQHPAPAYSRPAPEDSRGTPAPRREGRGRQQHQTPQPMQSPSQPDSRASAAQEMEGRGQRDGREEGKEERPENDSKRAPPSLHPRQSQRPGAPAILPAVPAYTAREQPRRAPENRGINSAFVEYAEPPLTNAAHAIPGEARQGGYFTF